MQGLLNCYETAIFKPLSVRSKVLSTGLYMTAFFLFQINLYIEVYVF